MKSDKELLELLLKRVEKKFSYFWRWWSHDYGLCRATYYLWLKTTLFTEVEYCRLLDLIRFNKPKKIKIGRVYWWAYGRKYPRVKFLKKLISQVK
jgi:hypothetical protein